jgi:hypothetical protein
MEARLTQHDGREYDLYNMIQLWVKTGNVLRPNR